MLLNTERDPKRSMLTTAASNSQGEVGKFFHCPWAPLKHCLPWKTPQPCETVLLEDAQECLFFGQLCFGPFSWHLRTYWVALPPPMLRVTAPPPSEGITIAIPWQQKYLWTIPHIQWLEVAAENRPRANFQEGSGEKVLLPKTSPSGLPFSSLLVAVAGWKGGVGKGTKLQTLLNRQQGPSQAVGPL